VGLVADLRTRIAAVVADTMNGTPPERWDFLLADRIIADLGLKQVIDVNRSIPQSRWVTDWEAEK
jgi:hypothetical protein